MLEAFATLPALTGKLDTDKDALDWAAHDYGDIVHQPPAAVLRPATAADISTVIQHAYRHGLRVVPRGQGHSTAGQAQAPGGVVIDMNQLNDIHEVRPDRVIAHRMFGPLNWREALLFMRLHDLDHAGQLKKIAAAFGAGGSS